MNLFKKYLESKLGAFQADVEETEEQRRTERLAAQANWQDLGRRSVKSPGRRARRAQERAAVSRGRKITARTRREQRQLERQAINEAVAGIREWEARTGQRAHERPAVVAFKGQARQQELARASMGRVGKHKVTVAEIEAIRRRSVYVDPRLVLKMVTQAETGAAR